jgi:hypothetical protein
MTTVDSPMTAAERSARPTGDRGTGVSTVTAVGAVFAALGSVGYISLNGLEPREAFLHPISVVAGALATLGAVLLAFALVRWRTPLPAWATTAAAAGLVMVAAHAWFLGTGIVDIADHTNDEMFEKTVSVWIGLVMAAPKMLLGLVSFLGLAIAGRRQKLLPRSSALLLGTAGVLSLWPPYPPALLAASLALFLVSRSVMPSRA